MRWLAACRSWCWTCTGGLITWARRAAAGAYVDAFMGNIDWAAVHGRYQRAVHAASEPFGASQHQVGDALMFDVRRAGVFDNAGTMISGARWCDRATAWQAAGRPLIDKQQGEVS